jgi:hypothetical protein
MPNDISIATILGPWVDPNWESGLVHRCKEAWDKSIETLTNGELATLLGQRIAVEHILSVAHKRLEDGFDDGTEMYDGELNAAIEYAVQGT